MPSACITMTNRVNKLPMLSNLLMFFNFNKKCKLVRL